MAPFGWNIVKPPPTMILPSACWAMDRTTRSTLGSKVVSSEPSELKRAIRLRTVAVAAPFGCAVVNVPPATTLPSDCTTTVSTSGASVPPRLGSNVGSSEPSALSRAMWFLTVAAAAPFAWTVVK